MKYSKILISLFISGCSITGQFKEIEKGKYLITVYSNAFSSLQKISNKIDEKARNACKGGDWQLIQRLPSKTEVIKTYGEHETSSRVLVTKQVIACDPVIMKTE